MPNNCRPKYLLCCMVKAFERILLKYIFNFLNDNDFISPFQSGFKLGDTFVNQLTYFYHTFCKALDDGLVIRIIFVDISKAFDKVWHKGLLLKLKKAGNQGPFFNWFSVYLSNRRQSVVLPWSKSDWSTIIGDVPQGSGLGLLLFLVCINDIVEDIGSSVNLFIYGRWSSTTYSWHSSIWY